MSQKAFGDSLRERGFKPGKDNEGDRCWVGIGLVIDGLTDVDAISAFNAKTRNYYTNTKNEKRSVHDLKTRSPRTIVYISTGPTVLQRILGWFTPIKFGSGQCGEQTAITVLSDTEAKIAALEARRDKSRALKQGIMQDDSLRMIRTLSESAIARALAEQVSRRLTRRVITHLQGIDYGLVTSNDAQVKNAWDELCVQGRRIDALLRAPAELKNTWEEICVQVQYGERSLVWCAYDEAVRLFLKPNVDELPEHKRAALWLQTSQGDDWRYMDDDERDPYPVCSHEIVDYLLSEHIYTEAMFWSNARIRAFIERLA